MLRRRDFLLTLGTAAWSLGGSPAVWAGSRRRRWMDTDGTLQFSGKREFVLGLYQLPKRTGAMRDAAAAGFNLLHRPPTVAAYDEAWAQGLRGWSSVGSLPEGNDRPAAAQRIRALVEGLRHHPGLLFWETEDEPTYVWQKPDALRVPAHLILETAAWVRRWDPDHALYLNHSPTHLVETLRCYNSASDIVATDIYPVIPAGIPELYALWPDGRQGDLADHTLAQVGRYADKMRTVAGPNRAVFMVLQAFAWEDLREKGRDPGRVLYPTLSQLRFMAWQSVIHGVQGILWWGLSFLPEGAELWNDLLQVTRELASVKTALAAPPRQRGVQVRYHETGHSLDRGVEWTLRRAGTERILAAVNADPNPVEVTFTGLPAGTRIRPLWPPLPEGSASASAPRVSREGWRERFEPHGTRVWRLET
ncbi:MAG: hypothetical protein IT580_24245 [Verrucomicrobiales bacterium]|nr:hypothetical protein [Verrucomicrobiales bacterium]